MAKAALFEDSADAGVVPGIFSDDGDHRNRSGWGLSVGADRNGCRDNFLTILAEIISLRVMGSGDAAAQLLEGLPAGELGQEQGLDFLEAFAVGA